MHEWTREQAMSAASRKTVPLATAIGAEISGVDPGKPLDIATEDAIYKALIDHPGRPESHNMKSAAA